ncbi:MAG TPA: hypothetical protein VM597_12110, partial [Gemmataceae bacterium]|nr:hypothetical protein [Gemmataceae bacterium]
AGTGPSARGAAAASREQATLPGATPKPEAEEAQDDAAPAAGRPLAVGTTPAGVPISFVENQGQWADPDVRFSSVAGPVSAGFTDTEIRLTLGSHRTPIDLAFEGASPAARVAGEARGEAYFNYFIGDDPSGWRTRVPTYASVRYEGLYDGVDVRVREGSGGLEYDVLLEPGADLGRVSIRADGASGLEVAGDGSLLVHTPDGDLRQPAPVTWEVLPDGSTSPVETHFRLIDAGHFGFDAPGWDPARPLVVDPGLEWSTYVGGGDLETVESVAVAPDGSGDIVVAGGTESPSFYGAPGVPDHTQLLPFVARLDSTGSTLRYATVFGSGQFYGPHLEDMALDAAGGPVLVGSIRGPGMPVTPGAYDTTFNSITANGQVSNTDDVFVARFDATGSRLVFSTYLGTAPTLAPPDSASAYAGGNDYATQVAVDAAGNVVLAGATNDAGFPTTAGACDRTYRDGSSFLARLNPTGSQLSYSTFYGRGDAGPPTDMAVDPNGFVTLTGQSGDGSGTALFPTTPDALKRDHADNRPGTREAYLARFKPDGAGAADLRYATLFPGNEEDQTWALAVSPNDPELVTVAGDTRSYNFVTTPGAYQRIPVTPTDWGAAFVTRFRFPAAGGGQLVWSTLLSDGGFPSANAVAVDAAGNAVVAGVGAPVTTDGAYDRRIGGMSIVRLSADGRRVLYGTQLGGAGGGAWEARIAVTGPDSVVVAGRTEAPDYPTTPGAFDRVLNDNGSNTDPNAHWRGLSDAAVSGLTLRLLDPGDTSAAVPTPLGPANGAAFAAPTSTATVVDVTFDWSDVADPAGVRGYELEVSPDADFVLNRLNVSEWTGGFTTESQKTVSFAHFFGHLGTYHWRVRTLDGANNYSPWSGVRTLNLGQATLARISSVRLASPDATGGTTVTGTIVLQDRPAPAGGFAINLTSTNPAVARVPATVTVPAGATRVSFPVTTSAVAKSTAVMIEARDDGLPDRTVLWVDPGAAPAAVSGLSFAPSAVTGGGTSQGTVTLSAPAPAGGLVVTLSSGNAAVAVPATVTVPAGASSAAFTVTTSVVSAATAVAVTATGGGASRSATLTVNPPAAVTLANLTVNPTSVTGGSSATGTVTLSGPAPAGGLVVSLSSGNPAVAGVPASVTVPAGATSASFTVTTAAVTANTTVTLTATAGGVTRTASLTVTPRPADTVSVARAEYTVSKRELRVEATSTSGSATLRVYVTGTNQLIGTLTNKGGGRYEGQFAWPSNPQNVTVRSSLGGSATRAVTAK